MTPDINVLPCQHGQTINNSAKTYSYPHEVNFNNPKVYRNKSV